MGVERMYLESVTKQVLTGPFETPPAPDCTEFQGESDGIDEKIQK